MTDGRPPDDSPFVARAGDPEAGDPLATAPILGYLRAIRAHPVVCVLIVLAAVAGSAAWIVKRSPTYETNAELLVSPVSETDRSFVGLPLIRSAPADPARPVKTAATLIDSMEVARRASALLDGELDPDEVETGIEVSASEEENTIEVKASATSGGLAARLANAYVEAAIAVRRDALRPLVAEAIRTAQDELAGLPPGAPRAIELRARIGDLRTISTGTDPTLSIAQRALEPSTAEGLSAYLILLLALASGIAIAAATAILIELLAPAPIDDEDQLRALFPLPVLARIPRAPPRPLASSETPPGVREAFRTLRGQLEFRGRGAGPRLAAPGRPGLRGVIAVASPSVGDGRTTVALSLARAIAAVQVSTLVIEANVRDPDVAAQLEIEPERDLSALLDSGGDLDGVVTPVPDLPNLGVVVSPRVANLRLVEELSSEASRILARARQAADCVVVDTPPLSVVSDALPILSAADQVVLVVRARHTTRSAVAATRELLAQWEILPAGYVIVESPLAAEAGSVEDELAAARSLRAG